MVSFASQGFFRQNNNFRQIHHQQQHQQTTRGAEVLKKNYQSLPHFPIPLVVFLSRFEPFSENWGAPSWSSTQRYPTVTRPFSSLDVEHAKVQKTTATQKKKHKISRPGHMKVGITYDSPSPIKSCESVTQSLTYQSIG